MGADEIIDWMAYEVSQSQEFVEKLANEPIVFENPDDEADALREMFLGLCK